MPPSKWENLPQFFGVIKKTIWVATTRGTNKHLKGIQVLLSTCPKCCGDTGRLRLNQPCVLYCFISTSCHPLVIPAKNDLSTPQTFKHSQVQSKSHTNKYEMNDLQITIQEISNTIYLVLHGFAFCISQPLAIKNTSSFLQVLSLYSSPWAVHLAQAPSLSQDSPPMVTDEWCLKICGDTYVNPFLQQMGDSPSFTLMDQDNKEMATLLQHYSMTYYGTCWWNRGCPIWGLHHGSPKTSLWTQTIQIHTRIACAVW